MYQTPADCFKNHDIGPIDHVMMIQIKMCVCNGHCPSDACLSADGLFEMTSQGTIPDMTTGIRRIRNDSIPAGTARLENSFPCYVVVFKDVVNNKIQIL